MFEKNSENPLVYLTEEHEDYQVLEDIPDNQKLQANELNEIQSNLIRLRDNQDNLIDAATFSTVETGIGQWVDGNPMYKKVFEFDENFFNSLGVNDSGIDLFLIDQSKVDQMFSNNSSENAIYVVSAELLFTKRTGGNGSSFSVGGFITFEGSFFQISINPKGATVVDASYNNPELSKYLILKYVKESV